VLEQDLYSLGGEALVLVYPKKARSTARPDRSARAVSGSPDSTHDKVRVDPGAYRQRHCVVVNAFTLLAQMEDDSCRFVHSLNEPADLYSHYLLQRALSGPTTSTSMPRVHTDAATSSPMKLTPTTRTCFAACAFATSA
jgi:hypothetical protein